MRVKHLNEFELQAYLDHEHSDTLSHLSRQTRQHVEGCLICREKLLDYHYLYGELDACPQVDLPKNFAKKVTLSLPPFAAAHTRAFVMACLGWSTVGAVSLGWLFSKLDWQSIFVRTVVLTTLAIPTIESWLSSGALFLLSLPGRLLSIDLPAFSFDWSPWTSLIDKTMAYSAGPALAIAAALVVLILSSLDSLTIMPIGNREEN